MRSLSSSRPALRFPLSSSTVRRGPVVGALCAVMALAACAEASGSPVEGNLLANARSTDETGIHRPGRLTDGTLAEEGDFWQTGLASRFDSSRASITFDLGEEKPVGCAFVQGDNNDTYRLSSSIDGATFEPLWDAGPVPGAGMRIRQSAIKGKARYLRWSAFGGDGLYTVAEAAVFSTCPPGWPNLSVERAVGVPLTKQANNSLWAFAIVSVLFLLVHRRGGPRWQTALVVAPLLAAINAAVALAEIYPFANTDEESLVRGIVALLAGVLVAKEAFFPVRLAPDPRVARAAQWTLAVLALGCYYHFGSAQFMDQAKGRLSVVHTWDMRNYFPTVKYFSELRFDGVYLASLAAYVDTVGGGDPKSVKDAHLRDLNDYHMMTGAEAAPLLPAIRARFSPERWEEFKRDMKYFIDTMGPRDYLGSMQDHGGNATPVWMLPAWAIYKNLPANEWTLGLAGLIDPVLLIILFVVVARTFGMRVMLYTVILFGATDFYQFGSNLMGSTLRQDWLVALGLGACALAKNRPFLGGFLLAYGGLIRAFPALAALFLLVPLVLWVGGIIYRQRRAPRVAEIVTAQRKTLIGIAGAGTAVVGLVLVTSLVFGYQNAWTTWFQKIEMHAVGPSTNNVGLRNLVSWRPGDTARALVQRQVPDVWVEWDRRQVENFAEMRPLFYLINLAAFLLVLLGVARRPLHQTTLLGLLLVPFFFYPSNYYCHFVFLLPMAVATTNKEEHGSEADRMFGLVTLVIAAMSVGQYFTMAEGWTDQRYTDQSFLLLGGFATIIAALALQGRRDLVAARAAATPTAVPPAASAPAVSPAVPG
ncbi:MAG TPA: hypothetical protein VGF45_05720 [Polyangia bacterium]